MYEDIGVEELDELGRSKGYPKPEHDWQDGYITGNVRLILWKVVKRLIADNVFASLRLA